MINKLKFGASACKVRAIKLTLLPVTVTVKWFYFVQKLEKYECNSEILGP